MSNRSSAAALAGALLFDAGLRSVGRGGRRRLQYQMAGIRWRAAHRASQIGFVSAGLLGGAAIAASILKDRREAEAQDDAAAAEQAARDAAASDPVAWGTTPKSASPSS